MMDLIELYECFNESKKYKDRWLALYKDLYFYVIPDRDAFNVKFNYRDDGKPTGNQIWDNTAMLAAYQRANDFHGLLLPDGMTWGRYALDPHMHSSEEIESFRPELDEANARIFHYLDQSNLSRAVSSSLLDLVGGTGGLWLESIDDEEPLYFRSIPAVCIYIEYSTDDVIVNCWYQMKMCGRYILKNFPDYKGPQYNALITAPNDEFTVIYGQREISKNKYYVYAVLEIDPYNVLWERESAYKQIIIFRDRVRPGEADGRGIGLDMLNSIRDLNRIVEYDRKSLAFKANPPVFYDADKYFNPYSIRQWAGAMIARNPQGRNPLEVFEMPTSPDTLQRIMQLQDFIKKGFQVDPLGEVESPVKSATEISIRDRRAQRTSVTDIARMINELPKQIYEESAKILSERQLLNKNRDTKLNFNKRHFKFQFQSPLHDLQKEANVNRLNTFMQILQQYYGPGSPPAISNTFEVKKFLIENLNLMSKLVKTDDELKEYMADMQNKAQQANLPQATTSSGGAQFPQ